MYKHIPTMMIKFHSILATGLPVVLGDMAKNTIYCEIVEFLWLQSTLFCWSGKNSKIKMYKSYDKINT